VCFPNILLSLFYFIHFVLNIYISLFILFYSILFNLYFIFNSSLAIRRDLRRIVQVMKPIIQKMNNEVIKALYAII